MPGEVASPIKEYAMTAVTNIAQYRAVRQKPATDVLRWHSELEKAMATNVRVLCAMQRSWFRLFL